MRWKILHNDVILTPVQVFDRKEVKMYPIAFTIGSLTIYWYGVMAAAGFLLATFVLRFTRAHADMSDDDSTNIMMIAMFAGLIGARIFYVVQFFHQFRGNLWKIICVDQGGLVFYGGFLFAIACLIIYAKIRKIDVVRMFDAITPAMALGHACGRIGCFLHGCCFGKPGDFLCVRYPSNSAAVHKYADAALHPVQLYEAGANFLAFWLFLHLARKGRRGTAMAGYLIYYGVLRFLTELLRGDNPHIWGLFTPAQLIGLVLIPTGAVLLFVFRKNAEQNA